MSTCTYCGRKINYYDTLECHDIIYCETCAGEQGLAHPSNLFASKKPEPKEPSKPLFENAYTAALLVETLRKPKQCRSCIYLISKVKKVYDVAEKLIEEFPQMPKYKPPTYKGDDYDDRREQKQIGCYSYAVDNHQQKLMSYLENQLSSMGMI